MPAPKVLRQSELAGEEATDEQQAIIDDRIERGVDLFDAELDDNKEPVKDDKGEPEKKTVKKDESTEEEKEENEDLLNTDDKDLDETQIAKKADLIKAQEVADREAEEDRILNTEDDDLEDSDREKKAELVKARDDAKSKDDKQKTIDDEVKVYAQENEMSEDDARKEVETIGKIVDNFKGDVKKLAKSNLHMQRLQVKTNEALKTLKNNPPLPPQENSIETIKGKIEAGKMGLAGKLATKEAIVEAYRAQHPKLGDDVSEDSVIDLISRNMYITLKNQHDEDKANVTVQAKEKRVKLYEGIAEKDKVYLSLIKPIIENQLDDTVLEEGYSLKDTLFWAKGQDSEKREKDAYDRGLKRGMESRKILGEVKTVKDGATKSRKLKGKTPLNDEDKEAAETMFANDPIPLARKYELYEGVKEADRIRADKIKAKEKGD